jgi:cytochrome c553
VTLRKFFFNNLLIGLCLAASQTLAADLAGAAPATAQQLVIGQRLYREGITGSGAPLKAQGAGQAQLGGAAVACVACHRRSGYGSSEGQLTVRPITAAALFEEQTLPVRSPRIKAQLGSRQRPAYNVTLLARAIRQGIDSAGKPLDSLMPRFALSDDDLTALAAYLATLSAQLSPGVDEQEIHFATVIQPGVAPERRRAMLDVMQAFFRDKGANVRQDEQRREAGNMRMYRAYRKWVLHVWELSGPSETWGAQLETYYRQQPVFALIGGMGGSNWRPIHEFSERFEIPSVFAQVELPEVMGVNNYSLYFSRGVTLEAEVLAKFLVDKGKLAKIVQVYRRDDVGLVASSAFRKALPPGTALEDHLIEGSADEAFWRKVKAADPAALVLWLGAQDLEGLQTSGDTQLPVYLSFGLLAGRVPPVVARAAANANIRMVYPSDLPPKHEARLLRSKVWLHNKGIPITDEVVQINTLFAMTVASDALGHIMDSFSRDYFVERIEHAVAQTPTPSQFQSVSLGPGQRYAAKGSSIVQLGDGGKASMNPLSGWLVP